MNNHFDIIFFGDSLTFGYGVPKQNSWAYKVTHELYPSSLNKACNGDTTTSMLSRYYDDVLKYNPSRLFIMCGTNDLLLGRSVNSIIDNIELMIKDAININSKIIIGIPPKIIGSMANKLFSPSHLYDYAEKELLPLRAALINLCEKYKLEFINFYDLTLNETDIYLDGIHLTSSGHNLMYKEWLNIFNKS
ncbi:GDSL-type esterase/lipase family protein [Clostridium sp. C2-6-12]|uniref:GDSL-type esterase/lipase family protein n=1 Tax=Clostridium sp. C2-6-12 TaxID=2698832 RepID=UPI001371531D|nr:GDSL-type esterase/lipase family protein [Clostridium sp. C2-6-12]